MPEMEHRITNRWSDYEAHPSPIVAVLRVPHRRPAVIVLVCQRTLCRSLLRGKPADKLQTHHGRAKPGGGTNGPKTAQKNHGQGITRVERSPWAKAAQRPTKVSEKPWPGPQAHLALRQARTHPRREPGERAPCPAGQSRNMPGGGSHHTSREPGVGAHRWPAPGHGTGQSL